MSPVIPSDCLSAMTAPALSFPIPGDEARAARWRSRCAAAAIAWASAGWPALANAQSPPSGEPSASDAAHAVQLNEDGSQLYAAGKYADALRAFQRAYSLVPEPNLLFNIAGCLERLGQRTQAVEYYRWFLGTASTDPNGRRRAIAALSRLEMEPPKPPPPPAPPPAPEPESQAWPLATLGAGILFAGLGAGLYLDGAHDHNQVTNAPGFGEASGTSTLTEVEAQKLIDAGDTKKRIGAVGFALGGALVATHVAINLWRASSRESGESSGELLIMPDGWAVAGKF
jgi:tetratricopeptide (TPR) repeat protein